MKYIRKLLAVLFITAFISNTLHAQCNQEVTISICEMENIDFNNDSTPDGIIDLYVEAGITPQSGDLWFDPGYNFALEPETGLLRLWNLDNASEKTNDYQFILTNSNCPDDLSATVSLVLGAYSGEALPPAGNNEVNIEVCDIHNPCTENGEPTIDIDLFETLVSLEGVPPPHLNGVWEYVGSPDKLVKLDPGDSNFGTTIAYIPGGSRVDSEDFEFTYTVYGAEELCTESSVTKVKISVVRPVSAGYGSSMNICESSLKNGDFDSDINLRDDKYLIAEDHEGLWKLDEDGQITSPEDSVINIKTLYDELVASNVKFGCKRFEFEYTVEGLSLIHI